MTREEQTISNLKKLKSFHNGSYGTDIDRAIKALEQEPCEDAINRQAVLDIVNNPLNIRLDEIIKKLPPVNPQPNKGHCKDCKHFEYDKVAKVDGIPLIVAHEICNKWGDGCKTSEDGYCFLFDPQENEDKG